MNPEPLTALDALDAAFLAAETPTMPLHVLAVAVLEPGPGGLGIAQVRELLADRLAALPRLRRKVARVPFGLDHPVWVDVPELDLDVHARRASLPPPGGPAELATFLGEVAGRPLDPDRPLWELTVVEGLESGHLALVAKVHHCLFDGVSGIAALAGLFDLVPGATAGDGAAVRAGGAPGGPERASADASGGAALAGLAASVARRWWRRPVVMADTLAGTYLAFRQLLGDDDPGSGGRDGPPSRTRNAAGPPAGTSVGSVPGGDAGEVAGPKAAGSSAGGAEVALPFRVPRAPWNGTISADRRCALAEIPLEDLRAVRAALGGTVNDVLLAVVGGALSEALAVPEGHERPGLVAIVPVSARPGGPGPTGDPAADPSASPSADPAADLSASPSASPSANRAGDPAASPSASPSANRAGDPGGKLAGNRVSAMLVPLGTDADDPVDRLAAVAAGSALAKRRAAALGEQVLRGWLELAVPALLTRLTRVAANLRVFDRLPPAGNVVVSNVAGPSVPLFLGDARVVALFPFGPVVDGIGLNISALSYGGTVHVGLTACRDLVPDLDGIASALGDAVTELVKHAAVGGRGAAGAARRARDGSSQCRRADRTG